MSADQIRRSLGEIAEIIQAIQNPPVREPSSADEVAQGLLTGRTVIVPTLIEGGALRLQGVTAGALLGPLARELPAGLSDEEISRLADANVATAIRNVENFQARLAGYEGAISAAITLVQEAIAAHPDNRES